MKKPWRILFPEKLYAELHAHLFSGDRDEHGAVVLAGLAETDRDVRLLVRELHLAQDGADYVPGKRGYRMLRSEFITGRVLKARDERLIYLAVHNHGGSDHVAFSGDDMRSHERGYPALLDITRGLPVGALVLAENAVAGVVSARFVVSAIRRTSSCAWRGSRCLPGRRTPTTSTRVASRRPPPGSRGR
jgi:hypothetical protein